MDVLMPTAKVDIEENTSKPKKRKLYYIELLRILAIFLVVFNHTGTKGFFLFSVSQDSVFYPVYLFISILTKVNVPIFFMISGALLLGKQESIKDVYKKRVLKYIIILIVISFGYAMYDWYFYEKVIDFSGFIKALYGSDLSFGLWYLYSYIGMLIMLPLLRKLVQNMEQKDYIYLTVCYLFFGGVIPICQFLISKGNVSLTEELSVALFGAKNIFYVIMGYYFGCVIEKEKFNIKNVLAGLVSSFLVIVISCLMTHYRCNLLENWGESSDTQMFFECFIAIPTFTLFVIVKYLFMKFEFNKKFLKIIEIIGSTTFGIYLLEKVLRLQLEWLFDKLEPIITPLPACFIWVIYCVVVGAVIVYILKKIPIIKNYI